MICTPHGERVSDMRRSGLKASIAARAAALGPLLPSEATSAASLSPRAITKAR